MYFGKQKYPAIKSIIRYLYRHSLDILVIINYFIKNKIESPVVFYGGGISGDRGGPLVKIKRLNEYFPENRYAFNLVYILSNAPYLSSFSIKQLKRNNTPIVFNQNGVFYSGWYEGDWKGENKRMSLPYHLADYVFYQSKFCQYAADKFLGKRDGDSEVLYNAVDTTVYSPNCKNNEYEKSQFTFLTTGRIGVHMYYKIESILRGFSLAINEGLRGELIIAGSLESEAKDMAINLIESLGIKKRVMLLGAYSQSEAPAIYRKADVYITTTHQDNCPNAVIEALSCGLPVIYSNTGGTPELVGEEAGIALKCQENWECPQVPEIKDISNGMFEVIKKHKKMSESARQRALEKFDISHWVKRHEEIFYQYLNN